MSDPKTKITREELHHLVWTRTFVRLAKDLGYNHPELAAICADLNIPRPSGGYWYRLEHGQAEPQVPLPPVSPGKPTEIPRGPRIVSEKPVLAAPEPSVSVSCLKPDASCATIEPEPKLVAAAPPIVSISTTSAPSNPVPLDSPPEAPTSVDYTREQLYEAIWSQPCIKLAAELGISDVALAKTCRRLGIPRPARGYWARIEAGEKLRRVPLPPPQPGQRSQVTFDVAANIVRREKASMDHIQTAGGWIHHTTPVELPPAGTELHPIAEKHHHALLKAKPDKSGFVSVRSKDLFTCDVSTGIIPRLPQAIHAIVCELEDRDYEFKAGDSEYHGLQIVRGNDSVTLNWTEAKLELEREPTDVEKRRPSWTWQLKDIKPAGCLTVEVSARGLKGKRKWTEDEGRTLEEVLGVVVEKIEAIFRGYEDQRKREAEWARQRAEQAKREAEQEAIKAEQKAREEKARKEREHIKRHEAKLEEIAQQRSDNLASAAQKWIEMQGVLSFIQACEERWRRAGGGTLSKEQTEWLSWARVSADKMSPKEYPNPTQDGSFDTKAVPVGGPYPETRKWDKDKPLPPKPTEIKSPEQAPPPPDPFPFWLMHRHR